MSISRFIHYIARCCMACFLGLSMLAYMGCTSDVNTTDKPASKTEKPKKTQTVDKTGKTSGVKKAGPGKDREAPVGVTTPQKSPLDEVEVPKSDLTATSDVNTTDTLISKTEKPKKTQTVDKTGKTSGGKKAGPGRDREAPVGVTTPQKSPLDEVEVPKSDMGGTPVVKNTDKPASRTEKPKKAPTGKTGKKAGPGKDREAPVGVTTPQKSPLDEVEVPKSDLTAPK
jgi:hypothetical protein